MWLLNCRKDSFITHRAFCDALAEESARLSANQLAIAATTANPAAAAVQPLFPFPPPSVTHISLTTPWDPPHNPNPNGNNNSTQNPFHEIKPEAQHFQIPALPTTTTTPSLMFQDPPPSQEAHKVGLVNSPYQNLHAVTAAASAHLSATALLQKAATIGATASQSVGHMAGLAMGEFGTLCHNVNGTVGHISTEFLGGFTSGDLATWQKSDRLTRDFLGLTGDGNGGHGTTANGAVNVSVNVKDMLTYTGSVEFQPYERHHSLLKTQAYGFAEAAASDTWGDC